MRNRILGCLAAFVLCAVGAQNACAAAAAVAVPPISPQALAMAEQVLRSGDHQQLPFAIVDKRAALVSVYYADGSLAGVSTVLVGRAVGDDAAPGVGQRTQSGQLRRADRTTPAGRFASIPGRNLSGEAIVWLDYESAFAIHRLRPALAQEKRPQRMASSDPRDKRISAGCVVVPEAFYDAVVGPLLGQGRAVVYVMPESRPWQQMWAEAADNGL